MEIIIKTIQIFIILFILGLIVDYPEYRRKQKLNKTQNKNENNN